MEKTGDYEIQVFKQDGKLMMRLPGGQVVPYDHRFPDPPPLSEGDSIIKPLED